MNAFDTNIWIYSYDSREQRKQAIALALIDRVEPLALLWQVGCEFLAAARKLEPLGFDRKWSHEALDDMREMANVVIVPHVGVWDKSAMIQGRLGLSHWDSLLVAACILGGVTTLYSEDFGTLSSIEDLEIINPFA